MVLSFDGLLKCINHLIPLRLSLKCNILICLPSCSTNYPINQILSYNSLSPTLALRPLRWWSHEGWRRKQWKKRVGNQVHVLAKPMNQEIILSISLSFSLLVRISFIFLIQSNHFTSSTHLQNVRHIRFLVILSTWINSNSNNLWVVSSNLSIPPIDRKSQLLDYKPFHRKLSLPSIL